MDHAMLLRDALREIRRLRSRVAELDSAAREPIAVIGLACRFPGAADCPDAFWEHLVDGVDAIRPVTRAGWNTDELDDPDTDAPNKLEIGAAGLLSDIDAF